MSPQLTVPALESTGLLYRWLIAAGDVVRIGQPVAIIVTKLQELAVPASAAGIIAALLIEEGTTVEREGALATIAVASETPLVRSQRATPVAKRIATHQGVDLTAVHGSGVGGIIRKRDVLARLYAEIDRAPEDGFCIAEQMGNTLGADETMITVAAPASHTPSAPMPALAIATGNGGRSTLVPHTEHARTMTAQSSAINIAVPQALAAINVDMRAIEDTCRQHQAQMARRGVDLTATACVVLATLHTLSQQRNVVAAWAEGERIQRAALHLAVVHQGSMVVLHQAADLSLQGIARALNQPQAAAGPATFTVHMADASWWSSPLVEPDQAAVLHVGATSKQVVTHEVGDVAQVVIRPIATLTLGYDARLISDSAAAEFLVVLRKNIEGFGGV